MQERDRAKNLLEEAEAQKQAKEKALAEAKTQEANALTNLLAAQSAEAKMKDREGYTGLHACSLRCARFAADTMCSQSGAGRRIIPSRR